MIIDFIEHGFAGKALSLFKQMIEGAKPNEFTFRAVLSASSHVGLVSEGPKRRDSLSIDYGVVSCRSSWVSTQRRTWLVYSDKIGCSIWSYKHPNVGSWNTSIKIFRTCTFRITSQRQQKERLRESWGMGGALEQTTGDFYVKIVIKIDNIGVFVYFS